MVGARTIRTALVTGSQAARVRQLVEDSCTRLFDGRVVDEATGRLSRTTRFSELSRWRPASLSYGDAGLAVLASAARDVLSPQASRVIGRRYVESGARDITEDMSLYGGLAGYASAVAVLRHAHAGDYLQLHRGLDQLTLPTMTSLANRADLVAAHYDVISGASGWWSYLSLHPDVGVASPARVAVVGALARLLDADPVRTLRIDPSTYPDPAQRVGAPYGYVDCGLAHGVAGIVAALAIESGEYATTPAAVSTALAAGADWIAAQAVRDADRVAWPRVALLGSDLTVTRAGTLDRPGWCYGTPGIARALWLAGRSLDDAGHMRLALAAVRSCVSDAQIARLETPTICHGLAGLLLIVAHFVWDTGDPGLAAAAGDLVDRLISRYEPASLVGFRDHEIRGGLVENAGFLNGAAGVGATLAATLGTSAPAWTRLLLLG